MKALNFRDSRIFKIIESFLLRYTLHKSSFTNTSKYKYSVTKATTVDKDISAHIIHTLTAIFNTPYV